MLLIPGFYPPPIHNRPAGLLIGQRRWDMHGKKNGKKGWEDLGNGEKKGKENEPSTLKGIATLSSMGIAMGLSTFIGLIVGMYLDKAFSTKPWLTIIFLIFGIIAGFKNIYEIIKKYGSQNG